MNKKNIKPPIPTNDIEKRRFSFPKILLASFVLANAMKCNTYDAKTNQTIYSNEIEDEQNQIGNGRIKTFAAWDYPGGNIGSEWNHASKQYELWLEADGLHSFDSDGFGVVNGRYVVAVTNKHGDIGDFFDVVLEDGTIIPCVIGDIKCKDDPKYNENEEQFYLEFMVKTSMMYNKGFGDPTKVCKPEWFGKAIIDMPNTGVNYFDNPEYDNSRKVIEVKSTFDIFER